MLYELVIKCKVESVLESFVRRRSFENGRVPFYVDFNMSALFSGLEDQICGGYFDFLEDFHQSTEWQR